MQEWVLSRIPGASRARPKPKQDYGNAGQSTRYGNATASTSSTSMNGGPKDTLTSDIRNLRQYPLFDSPIVNSCNNPNGATSAPNYGKSTYTPNTGNARWGPRPGHPQNCGTANPSSTAGPKSTCVQQPANQGQERSYVNNPKEGAKGPPQQRNNNTHPYTLGDTPRAQGAQWPMSMSAPFLPNSRQKSTINDSWAEDPVSDAEMIAIVDVTDRSNNNAGQRATYARPLDTLGS